MPNQPKKTPEIFVIDDDDDDDDDVLNAEIAAATGNGINSSIIQHDILSAAAAVAATATPNVKQQQRQQQKRPSVAVPNNTQSGSPFRISKFNNPDTCVVANGNHNLGGTSGCFGNNGSAIGAAAAGGNIKPTIPNHNYNVSNTRNATDKNDNNDNDPAGEIDNEDDHEQLPITQLPQPNYERQFKSTILKPLYNILDSSLKQDEILSVVRMNLFVIMQGIYLEARRIYVDQNKLLLRMKKDQNKKDRLDANSSSSSSSSSSPSLACVLNIEGSLIGKKNEDFDQDFFLNAPGIYIHNEENVFEYNMSECTFVDPDAEDITKKKLLPQVMRMLLQLGEGGGDKRRNFGEGISGSDDHFCLSVAAEDLIACIMLDFVGMVTKILSLVEIMEANMKDHRSMEIDDTSSSSSQNGHVNDINDDTIQSPKKRQRVENPTTTTATSTKDSCNKTNLLPNILEYIGDDILSIFTKVIGAEACCAGYNQALMNLRHEDNASVEDAINLYLPAFFKSHLFDANSKSSDNEVKILDNGDDSNQDDCQMTEGHSLKDYHMSALRSGEWKKYHSLYHITDATRALHRDCKDSLSSSNEARDAPPTNNIFMSRHTIAMTRYFVKERGLVNLNKILLDSLDTCKYPVFKPAGFDAFQSTISIFHTIFFISTYCVDNNPKQKIDDLCISEMGIICEIKCTLQSLVMESISRIHDFTSHDRQKLLDIIGTLEDRSLTEMEYRILLSYPTYLQATFSNFLSFNSREAHEMKLSALWKLLTGQDVGGNLQNNSVPAPSLQCQIGALNELNNWLKNLENQVRSNREQDMKVNNNNTTSPAQELGHKINPTSCRTTQTDNRNVDVVSISDDMPPLIKCDNLNENDSTEVCCYSNDSISSTNSDQNGDLAENKNSGNSRAQVDLDSYKRGNFSHALLNESETEFCDILEMMKSKYNILSHLFSPIGIHTELLKRSLPLLDTFVRNGKLKEENLKSIWDITGFTVRGKENDFHVHSSVTSTVFDLLLGLVNNNNGWMALGGNIIFWFEKLFFEVKDIDRWTPQSLGLVETIAHRSIDLTTYQVLAGKEDSAKSFEMPAGFDFLWLLSQDNCTKPIDSKTSTNAEIALGALLRVVETIMTKSKMSTDQFGGENNEQFSECEKTICLLMQKIQTKIIIRVIDSLRYIKESSTNTTNVRLLHHLLLRLPTFPLKRNLGVRPVNSNDDKIQLILSVEDVVNHHNLLSTIVEEMVSYAMLAKEKLTAIEIANDGNSHIIRSNLYKHKDCVLFRQQLFQMYVSKCFELCCKNQVSQNQVSQMQDDTSLIVTTPIVDGDFANNEEKNSRTVMVHDYDEKSDEQKPSVVYTDSLFPSKHHISKIWNHFVKDSNNLDVIDCVIQTLYHLLTSVMLKGSTQILIWRKDLISQLYRLFIDLELPKVSATAYRLLIYCIGHQNALCEKFQTISYNLDQKSKPNQERDYMMSNILLGISCFSEPATSSNSLFIHGYPLVEAVTDYNILGLEKLWTIVLESRYDDVANMAMKYIAVLYNFSCCVNSQSAVEMSSEQVTFARHCISELDSDISDRKRQTRLLNLMRLFVQHSASAQQNQIPFSHGSSCEKVNALEVESIINVTSPFSLFVQITDGPRLTIHCPLGERTKVSFLRDSISRHLRQDFRLVFAGCELKQNSAMLVAHQIKASTLIFCCPRLSTKHVKNKDSVHVVEAINEDYGYGENNVNDITETKEEQLFYFKNAVELRQTITPGINEILSEHCLKKLFHLLSCWDEHEEKQEVSQIKLLVWDLLQSLPTEPVVQDGINSMFFVTSARGDRWKQFLANPVGQGTNCGPWFRLLYSLQVVERIFLHIKECLTSFKDSHKQWNGRHKRKNSHNDIDECVVHVPNEKKQVFNNKVNVKPIVLIGDDDDDNDTTPQDGMIHDKDHIINDNLLESNEEIEPRKVVDNFVQNGGLRHFLELFLSFDVSCFQKSSSETPYNHELCSLVVTCANKLIYLLFNISNMDEEYTQCTLASIDQYSPVFDQLLKMVHWAVHFQLVSSETQSQSSKFITGGWSSAEIGGALALHCLNFMKLTATRISNNNVNLRMFMNHEVLTNAMASSIIRSPSNMVRSSSLIVFKKVLYFMESNGEWKRQKLINSNDGCSDYFRLPLLSLLVSLLPVGREIMLIGSSCQSEISSRCFVLFDLVTNYISNALSNLNTNAKQIALTMLVDNLQRATVQSFSDANMCKPPEIGGIDEIGKLVLWAVLDLKLLTCNNVRCVDTYVEGLASILQSIIVTFQADELNTSISNLMISNDQTLLDLLFKSATFVKYEKKDRTKFHCTESSLRKKLLDLILVLCKGSERNQKSLFVILFKYLYSAIPRTDLVRDWSVDPVLKQKGYTGHVGMKNQGATCYLNSLLQQFFHTPAFRSGLMSCEIGSVESKNEISEEERLIFELQRLFGNLLMSEKRDFDTMDLVKSIRGYDGNTIRPGEQQDVDEFFNLFCTRLETALKELPQSRLLHDVFGGQISHLITCKKCQKSSERIEDFLSISLDVKGKRNIFESLHSYIRGEVLDGANKYFCSNCNCKRDCIKRCCVKTLPNVLICHLKRFDFDLEQLRKIKVNDRFEYPIHLNMKNFTTEGLKESCNPELDWREETYYQYTLRGVVVHTGTADSGHYYSLSHVREHGFGDENSQMTEGSWYCFNDSIVSPFDPTTLEITTFGGVNDSNYRHVKRNDSSKSYSAYLLLYDRVDQYKFDEQSQKNPQKSAFVPIKSIPKCWEAEIVKKNLRHVKDQIIFSTDYGRFITGLCNAGIELKNDELTLKAIETLTFHLMDNIIHARERGIEIQNQFSTLMLWYEQSNLSCTWLLRILSTSHRHWLDKVFFHCYKEEIRISFVKLLGVVFQKLSPVERCHYYEGINQEDINNNAFDADSDITVFTLSDDQGTSKKYKTTLNRIEYWQTKSVLGQFVGTLINMLDECEAYWRRFDQLFECLSSFADCGHEEAIFLIRSGLILRLISIYQGDKNIVSSSFLVKPPKSDTKSNETKVENKRKMSEKDRRPNFIPLLKLFSILIRSGNLRDGADDISDSDSSIDDEKSSDTEQFCSKNVFITCNCLQTLQDFNLTYDLPNRDCYLSTGREIIETMLNEFTTSNQKVLALTISQILCHFCFNDLEKTLSVCAIAQRVVQDKKASESKVAMQVLSSLVVLNDKYTKQRIDAVTTSFVQGISSNVEYEQELLLILEAINQRLLMRSPGEKGPKHEVFFHKAILNNLESFTSLFGRKISNKVKHKILRIIRNLLPRGKLNFDIHMNDSPTKTVLCAYSGYDMKWVQHYSNSASNFLEDDCIDFVEIETVQNQIFMALKDLHMSVADAIHLQCTQARNDYAITNGILNDAQIVDSSMFSDYYAALRECLTDSKCRERLICDDTWVNAITEYIMSIFWDLDNGDRNQQRSPADILKGEIIRLFELLAELDPKQFINTILTKQLSADSPGKNDPVTKLLEVYITTNNNYAYNHTYMVHYYGLLARLANNNSTFYDGVLNHENWKWALRSFVLNKTSAQGRLYNVILTNTVKYVEDNFKFRQAIYKVLSESFLQEEHVSTAALKLLSSVFDSECLQSDEDESEIFCITLFVSGNYGGMSKMSSWTKNLYEQTTKEFIDDSVDIKKVLLDLYHCMNCMFVIIGALEPKDINNIMKDCWPEVDEMNSIFMQIITRSDDEWNDCYGDDVNTKKIVDKTISTTTDLQRLLIEASTKTTDTTRQE